MAEQRLCEEVHALMNPQGFYAHYIWRREKPDGSVKFAIEVSSGFKIKPTFSDESPTPMEAYLNLMEKLRPTAKPENDKDPEACSVQTQQPAAG